MTLVARQTSEELLKAGGIGNKGGGGACGKRDMIDN